jgi:2-methylcitrate dehydratase PrpD
VTLSRQLAALALAPLQVEEAERLRALTLTNVAAGLGELGRVGPLIEQLPLDTDRAPDAAFLHALRLHGRTQDDFHPAGRIHVGAVTLATALALADDAEAELLECLAAGYRVMCAVATAYSADAQRRGCRPTGVFGPIGAAASAARALGLDEDGTANAIGLAAARSGGTNQSWIAGTDEWMLELGAAARAGVEAAQFTRAGAAAAPDAFEGAAGWGRAYFADEGAEVLVRTLAEPRAYIAEVAVKPYPVSGIAQVPTELGSRGHADLDGERVGRVVVRLPDVEAAYPGSGNVGPFRSRSAALMSVAFCVACSLTDGNVRLARLERPDEIADVTSLVRVEADSALAIGQAVLAIEVEGEQREYAGDDVTLLFPPWEAIAREGNGVATRSEADPGLVARAVEALGVDHPDARVLNTILGAVS